jgi:hypothetical protein
MNSDPGRTVVRQRLLEQMTEAKESEDQQKADAALVAANRFLKPGNSYIPDAAIENARAQLRAAYPPGGLDTEEANPTQGKPRPGKLVSHKQAKRRRRERWEIQAALAEQLRLLAKRCRDFDAGDWGEAVGMAARLRVILNPGGKKSPSILQSLDAEKLPLLSTCEPIPENALYAVGGLYRQTFAKDETGVSYELSPKLGDTHYRIEIPAPRWWEQVVSIVEDEGDRHVYRRKDVITEIANKDGGAHLAEQIPEHYDVMSKPGGIVKITIGPEDGPVEVPIAGVHLAMLRQTAYEVLNSPALLDLADSKKR